MPLFMDIHSGLQGLTAADAEGAHKRDLEVQAKHGANFIRYWFNEDAGRVFCLVEAPSKEAARATHVDHGLVPEDIIEVREGN